VRHRLQERRQREGSVQEVSVWLQVYEDTFYTRRHRSSDAIASALRECEAAVWGLARASAILRRSPARFDMLAVPAIGDEAPEAAQDAGFGRFVAAVQCCVVQRDLMYPLEEANGGQPAGCIHGASSRLDDRHIMTASWIPSSRYSTSPPWENGVSDPPLRL